MIRLYFGAIRQYLQRSKIPKIADRSSLSIMIFLSIYSIGILTLVIIIYIMGLGDLLPKYKEIGAYNED